MRKKDSGHGRQKVEVDVSSPTFPSPSMKRRVLAFVILRLTSVGGGFSSGKSDRRGASLSPTSLTSFKAGAAARVATSEEEEPDRKERRRPIIGAAALVTGAVAFREADGDACTPRMLMARILIGR